MKKAMSIKNRLISAVLVLVMTFTSLVGTTFAWFTDTVTSVGNTIESGTLKVDLLHKDGDDWISLKENEDHLVFDYKKWEPGFTLVETLKVQNLGSLALKYKLSIEVEAGTAKLGKNGENLADVIDVWVYYGETTATGYGDITAADSGWVKKGTLTEVFNKPGEFMNGNLLPTGKVSTDANVGVGDQIVNIALHMQESAGNEYQKLSAGNIYVNLIATQLTSESDSFGSDYDSGAEFPTFSGSYIASAPVVLDSENKVVEDVMLLSDDGTVGAIVPAGTLLKPGTTKVTLNVTTLDRSNSNVVASENQNLNAIDVHVAEVAEGNTTPVIVTLEKLLAPGLNMGNYDLYHVEGGATVVMSHVADAADLDVHNEFTYDPATGDVKVAMASFSEVVTLVDKENAWEGGVDHTWYDASKTELTIANADQLWSFSQIVGNMAKGIEQDGFEGKTVKLIADINLGDAEDSNNSKIIFYPIGYWNNEGTYERLPLEDRKTAVDSGLYTFYGTFDGNGHTISNFYQNTWEMKGDHNWYSAVTEQYYRDGMGLFGRVYGATIKNLTVTNFSSDGEIATTGVIAAYADCGSTFENIAIFNCNPRVYNIGNGGIVGCAGWYNKTESTAENPVAPITFKNITVDNSNKISALWGSYDVPCGGILGQYYPTSGQSSYNYPANTGLYFENCHVSAQLDVYNDVCANYQYYAYRYAGMLIGSVRENTTTADGKTIPDMTGITASGCTVNFGDWNDYYYCELVSNGKAAYTHDHKMSRLEQVASVDVENKTVVTLKGKTVAIPTSGKANYVVVKSMTDGAWDHGDGSTYATCYHFVDGVVWNHSDAGTEIVNEVEVLKEDKTIVYREFNNLVTGYGWGVTTMAINYMPGVNDLDVDEGEQQESVVKFNGKLSELVDYQTYKFGDIFEFVNNGVDLVPGAISVSVNNLNTNNPVTAIITYAEAGKNWKEGTITLKGAGSITITIQDYYFCTPTTIAVTVTEHTHEYDSVTTNPDCLNGGHTTYTCSVCNYSYIADNTDALGHNYNIVVTAPTCTADGYTTYTCTVCNYTYVGDEIASLGHKYSAEVTAPTCTEGGYTTYTCSCGDNYVADETAALGHNMNPATCLSPSKCVRCSYTEGGLASHNYEAKVIAPTCTTGGYTTYTCKNCPDEYTVDEVAALGHAFEFESKFNGDFLYRVGNQNTVALDSLFTVRNYNNIKVEITPKTNGVGGTYSDKDKAIQFTGTGLVTVIVTDTVCKESTTLYLEVVEATNVTGLSGTISGNVVLLNDCGLSSLTVSGRNTVYGNGFTATYSGNGQYLNNGLKQGVVNVSENGTLDNLRIKATIYPNAYMYYGSTTLGDYVQGGPSSTEGDKTRYHYQLSAVAASGNATISNCYIYGGRNNVFVNTGDVTIKDSVLECGVVANVQIQSNASHTITLENVTTIQYQVNPTIGDTSKVMLGAGVLVGPETTENPKIVLNGSLKQYNWVTENDKEAVAGEATKKIINAALGATAYNHIINGYKSSNLGIIYMNTAEAIVENNVSLPYVLENINIMSATGQVYSLQSANANQIYSDYENADRSTINGWYQPQFKYPTDLGGQYVEKDSGDEHCYREGDTIYVMFPSGDTKEIDLAALVNITKYSGQDLNLVITCKDENGNAVAVTDGKVSLSAAGKYTVTYTVTDTLFYDKDGNVVTESVEYYWNAVIDVSLKDTKIPDAHFEFDATKQKMGYYKPSIGDVKQYIPFLAGLKIYDYNGQTKYLRFDGSSDFNKVASITITGYESNKALVEIKLTDGGVINTRFLSRANSGGGSTYTGKIKTSNNTIYFVTDSGTSNKDTTTTAAYWYVDYYKFTGNNGVAIQSGQQTFNSTGSSASTPSGSFNTSIKYTVTYDANNGNCGQTVGYATSAATAVTLPTPTRSGYIFAGWYTAAIGGTRVGGAGDSYTPSANITLYAQWGKPCTVNYDANGGSCNTAFEKYTGTTLTLPTPTRDGYWFLGWYDAAEGGNKIGDAGAKYNPTNEITLYAHWQEAIEYTVTYNANGGSCGTASATYQGKALTLPAPTRTGYTFTGWYTAASGGTKIGDAGVTYVPSANTTLYAQWKINSYTITVTTSNATVKVNGTTVNNNGTVSIQYGAQVTVEVTYSKSDSRSTTIKGADGTTYTSPFTMPAQNVTINATSKDSCVTADTLVMLADGTQKRIDEVTTDDMLLVWNFYTGDYDAVPAAIIFYHDDDLYEVIKLYFEDGTVVNVIENHGFYDVELDKFIFLDETNADEYIGHKFVKVDGDGRTSVALVGYEVVYEYTGCYSIQTAVHINFVVEGMLSLTIPPMEGWFDYFEIGDDMKYDEEKMQADIEKYGLYEYEVFAEYGVTYEQFIAFNGPYLKVLVGRGVLTFEEILELISQYVVTG